MQTNPTPITPIPAQPNRPSLQTDKIALLIACAATVTLWFIPVASDLLYPVRLFVTFIHEGSHALVALLTGGSVEEIAIQPDASGVTLTAGGIGELITSAGYLGATVYGAGLLLMVRKQSAAKGVLVFSGVLIGVLTLAIVRPWTNFFGWIWGLFIGLGLLVAGQRLSPRNAQLAGMFLGVQCCLNALIDLRTLIGLSAQSDGPISDAVLMSQMITLPAEFWALSWSAIAVVVLLLALRPFILKTP